MSTASNASGDSMNAGPRQDSGLGGLIVIAIPLVLVAICFAAKFGFITIPPGPRVGLIFALLMAMMWGFRAQGQWSDERGTNLLDTGAPFYDTYETADGGYVAVGAIEPQFYAELRSVLGIADDPRFDSQTDHAQWLAQKTELARLFKAKTRDQWTALFEGIDACVTPVLSMAEALEHPHNRARQSFITLGGAAQPAPAPRYSSAPSTTSVASRPLEAD